MDSSRFRMGPLGVIRGSRPSRCCQGKDPRFQAVRPGVWESAAGFVHGRRYPRRILSISRSSPLFSAMLSRYSSARLYRCCMFLPSLPISRMACSWAACPTCV
jgi:hypothetical protein